MLSIQDINVERPLVMHATLAGPSLQENIHKILTVLSKLNLASGPDPIWGYAQASGIVDTRVAALGVLI